LLNGKTVGYFETAFNSFGNRGYITDFEIYESFRGRGLGRIFVDKIERYLISKGAKMLIADSVRWSAVEFWGNLGYEPAPDGSGYMFKPVWADKR